MFCVIMSCQDQEVANAFVDTVPVNCHNVLKEES